jgi:hypothetical protein
VPLYGGRGGMVFLTGTIAYALRMIYDWMLGIKPTLDGLAIDPCVPSEFDKLEGEFTYQNKKIELEILNPDGNQTQVKEMDFTINTTMPAAYHTPLDEQIPDELLQIQSEHLVKDPSVLVMIENTANVSHPKFINSNNRIS